MPVHWQNLQFCCRVEAERAADPRKNGVAEGIFAKRKHSGIRSILRRKGSTN